MVGLPVVDQLLDNNMNNTIVSLFPVDVKGGRFVAARIPTAPPIVVGARWRNCGQTRWNAICED